MPRKSRESKEFPTYFCPKCGNEVPRSDSGILVLTHNRELGKGCCTDCGDKPSPEAIEQASKIVLKMLVELLWKKHGIDWNRLTYELRYKVYRRFLGVSMEEVNEYWERVKHTYSEPAPEPAPVKKSRRRTARALDV